MSLWLTTLKTKDPEEAAKIYSDNATFLSTVSSEFKKGKEGAREYFEHFLAKNPEGKVVDEVIQPLGTDAYIHSGMYNFKLDGDDKRVIIQARFSYVWQKDNSRKWHIINHHSSVRPESH